MARIYAAKDERITEREIRNMERARRIASQGMVLLKNDSTLPFTNVRTIAAFGNGVRKTVKGGTGSGDVNSRKVITVEQGLLDAGYELTSDNWLTRHMEETQNAFAAYLDGIKKAMAIEGPQAIRQMFENPYMDPDVPVITGEDLACTADAALYVLARNSGEGADRRPIPGDYELTENEKQNLTALASVYKHIVVVLNVGGVIDTRFIRSLPEVGAILNMSQGGNTSGWALADILSGKISPSGHLTGTWAEHYEDYPSAATFSHMNGDLDDEYYGEGIYVGYRYFDTFGIEPAYPFGYGLSYTSFDITGMDVCLEGTRIHVTADVQNTGTAFSGREVVQVYLSAPKGVLEKPYQELAGYAKTKELAPGESEQVKISFDLAGRASYDELTASYLLEKGRYFVRVGNHSRNTHIAASLMLPESVVTQKLSNRMQPDVPFEVLSSRDSVSFCYPGEAEEMEKAPVLTLDPTAFTTEVIAYALAPEPFVTEKSEPVTLKDVKDGKASLGDLLAQLSNEEMAELVVGTARHGDYGGFSMIGAASSAVPGAAGDTTSSLIESRKIPNLVLADGPAGLRLAAHFVADADGFPIPGLGTSALGDFDPEMAKQKPERPADAQDYYQYCTAIPIATSLAQSWDLSVIEEAGDIVGEEMELFGVHLWLAPGMNIQRNPLCGRNFEYYSEDPLIAGLCAAADTRGVQAHVGRGTTIKHFCLNNNEDNRSFINCHAKERTIREIYLRGFEIAVKLSQPLSLMSSYNLVNGIHSANNYDLLTAILRDEWGFEGFVVTDWGTTGGIGVQSGGPAHKYPTSDAAGCVYAGNDLTQPGHENDIASILRSIDQKPGTEGVLYPITRANLQMCAMRILKAALLTDLPK